MSEPSIVHRKNGEQLQKLGSRGYFAAAHCYMGEVKIHIRRFLLPDGEHRKDYIPTLAGVTLTVDELSDLREHMPALEHRALNLLQDLCVKQGDTGGESSKADEGEWLSTRGRVPLKKRYKPSSLTNTSEGVRDYTPAEEGVLEQEDFGPYTQAW